MHFQLIEKEKRSVSCLWTGLWLAALMGTILSLMGSMSYFWAVLPGVALVLAACFLTRRQQGIMALAVFAVCALWFLLRYKPILNGLGFLANRLFTLSEESQGYYYVHFNVVGEAPGESLFFVTCIIGVLCVLLGGAMNLLLTLLVAVVIAYFGVVPAIGWVCALLTAAFVNALPKRGRWLPAILIAAFVTATAFSIQTMVPEPNLKLSIIVDKLWELVVPSDPPQVEAPPPTEPPVEETEPTEEPTAEETFPEDENYEDYTEPQEEPTEEETQPPSDEDLIAVPNGGQVDVPTNWPLLILKLLLAPLAVVGVSAAYQISTKKRKGNRASIFAKDNAEAIRGMYLYAKRWRKLQMPEEAIPVEVEAIWLEAAYSDHEMTDSHRAVMHSFMRETVQVVWDKMKWWERFVAYCYLSL